MVVVGGQRGATTCHCCLARMGGPKAEGEPRAMCTPFILGHKMSPTNNSVSHTEQTELKMHKTKQEISLEHNNG